MERANGLTKCGKYLLASSLAAALLNGLFLNSLPIKSVFPSIINRSDVAPGDHRL
jgi:hypothetical protein